MLYANREQERARKREYNKRYYERNREKLIAAACERQRLDREGSSAKASRWRKRNLATDAATRARRRAEQDKRTPPWANGDAIKAIYKEATALGMEVDHVIPLRGRLVSGLHVESNLQLLSRTENIKKGNRFPGGDL